jgi:GT2 family glycosyltransferase
MTLAPPTARCRVSVIICAYTEDRWSRLGQAIESVRSQTRQAEEVVLVIDHCPALAARARAEFADIVVTENDSTPGLSGARNVGLRTAMGDVVAFIDDDAAAAPDWLDHLSRSYEDDDVVGVGGHVEPSFSGDRPGWFPPEFDWVIGCSHTGMPRFAQSVRNFVGANMSFRRQALVDLGGFSESLGRVGANAAGCEETELCIRVADWRPGGRLVYVPEARVDHHVPPARTTWRYFLRRCYAEGRSKAVVTTLTGRRRGLEAERSYLRSTVPKGVATSLLAAAAGHPAEVLRAATAIGGVASTSIGYALAQPRPRVLRLPDLRRLHPGSDIRGYAAPPAVRRTQATVGMAALALVITLWLVALGTTAPLGTMTDYGLLSVLPVTFWLALALLTVSFFWTVRQAEASRLLVAAHVVVLVLMVHATPALLYGTLRYSWAWKHVGITQYIAAHQQINLHLQSNPELVAYQDWPGFFAFNAFLTSAAKLSSALSYASWVPPVSELLSIGPLLLIFRHFTRDRRLVWTAVWLFFLGNWVGQDYYSPQSFVYFIYLAVIAVCLSRFSRSARSAAGREVGPVALDPARSMPDRPSGAGMDPSHRLHLRVGGWLVRRETWILYAMVALAIATIASSHQLTPFMLVSALVLLYVGRHLRYRSLPVLAMALAVGWIAFAAETFLTQNLASIIKSIGHPLGNTTSTLVNLQQASAGQILIAKVDRLLTVTLIVLAAIGWWRSRRLPGGSQRWRPALLLMASPLVAVVANNYGGEIGFRVYLFALPFIALFAAAALGPFIRGRRRRLALDIVRPFVAGLLLVGFLFAYYGKERMNYFPPDEVNTMMQLYRTAPPGSLLMGATSNLPWGFEHYNTYTYNWYTADDPAVVRRIVNSPVATIAQTMGHYRHAYLIFSSTDAAEVEMTGLLPRADLSRIERDVMASGRFVVVMRTPHITVVSLAPGNPAVATTGRR